MSVIDTITALLERYASAQKIYIAYSGGLDSHVLLQLCAQHSEWRAKLTAVYVHHGLQAVADEWERHCQRIAESLAVDYLVLRVNAQAERGMSPEEAARNARYQAFASLVQQNEILLLAQHQDDQLETVLLQLFRGAGLQGLAGMPEAAPLGQGVALRPLLNVSRQTLEAYALAQNLTWVEDPTNQSYCFDRNYLRHAILPLLKQRWPALAGTVSRSARHCANAHEAAQAQIETVFAELFDSQTLTLDLVQLQRFSVYQQRLLVRQWFQAQGLRMPSEAVLDSLFEQVIGAQAGREPELNYQQVAIRRYRQKLYCVLADSRCIKTGEAILWPQGQRQLALGGQQMLFFTDSERGIALERWQAARVTVRYRQGGERIRLPGRQGSHTLKKLFQEAAIPAWQREHIPLIFMDDQLAAVADLWVSRDVWVENQAGAIQMGWQGCVI